MQAWKKFSTTEKLIGEAKTVQASRSVFSDFSFSHTIITTGVISLFMVRTILKRSWIVVVVLKSP